MSLSVAGKSVIVTGAASGVGLAIGRHFRENGANVVFADTDQARLKDEVPEGEPDGASGGARVFAGDLRERLCQANLLSTAVDAFDRVDILVNASRNVLASDPLDPDDEAVETLLRQNLLTALRMTQMVARRMIAQSEGAEGAAGSIVNLSSIAARRAHPELLAYSVSSAAVDQMTRAMAVALAPKRIRVNAVAFGSVMSASLKGALKADAGMRKEITGHTPIGRIASPREVAEAVQFLASDGAGFVTGQIVTVDGGRTLLDPVDAAAH